MRVLTRAFLAFCMIAIGSSAAWAQTKADDLKAKGAYLTGAGSYLQDVAWYEVGMAEARAINTDTAIKIAEWNTRVYENYQRELAERGTKLQQGTKAIQRKGAEHQHKLRTDPTAKEVLSGEALNALVLDLCNPAITEPIWRDAKIPLTLKKPVHDLMFKLVASEAGKANNATIKGVIALSKLDSQNNWPIYLRDDALASERSAYEQAFQEVKEKSFQNKLDLSTVTRMDETIDRLKTKVIVVVPVERGFRKEATVYVEEMKSATAMFNASMIDFAQEMIRDTKDHDAQTVAQLLAFMRKYQLIFADASGNPRVGELYRALLPSLQAQKQALGLKDIPQGTEPKLSAKANSPIGTWTQHNEATGFTTKVFLYEDRTYKVSHIPNLTGIWSQTGPNITLTMNDRYAPGGRWITEVTLAPDGQSWTGTLKTNGNKVSATRDQEAKMGDTVKSPEGTWTHHNLNNNISFQFTFRADHTTRQSNNPNVRGVWSQKGLNITVRSEDPAAPGGVWILELTLSPDGQTYSGVNTNTDVKLSGTRN